MLSLDFLVPYFLVLLASLSVHEAAHAWTADRLGDPTARLLGRITLNPLAHIDWIGTVLFPLIAMLSHFPLFGWAKPVPVNGRNLREPRRDFSVIAAAGPISNLVLAVLVASVLALLDAAGVVTSGRAELLIAEAVVLNVTLAAFNLIPVPPLDGGNVLSGILPPGAAQLIDQLRPWGFVILYALLLSGILGQYLFPVAAMIAKWLLGSHGWML